MHPAKVIDSTILSHFRSFTKRRLQLKFVIFKLNPLCWYIIVVVRNSNVMSLHAELSSRGPKLLTTTSAEAWDDQEIFDRPKISIRHCLAIFFHRRGLDWADSFLGGLDNGICIYVCFSSNFVIIIWCVVLFAQCNPYTKVFLGDRFGN